MFMVPIVGYGYSLETPIKQAIKYGKFGNKNSWSNICLSYMCDMGFMNFRLHYFSGKTVNCFAKQGTCYQIERLTDWNMKTKH